MIKSCANCKHHPNNKHCIGCEWDADKRMSTHFELGDAEYIDRKVIEDIKAEIEQLYTVDTAYEDVIAVDKVDVLQIIDKYIKEHTE